MSTTFISAHVSTFGVCFTYGMEGFKNLSKVNADAIRAVLVCRREQANEIEIKRTIFETLVIVSGRRVIGIRAG